MAAQNEDFASPTKIRESKFEGSPDLSDKQLTPLMQSSQLSNERANNAERNKLNEFKKLPSVDVKIIKAGSMTDSHTIDRNFLISVEFTAKELSDIKSRRYLHLRTYNLSMGMRENVVIGVK